MPLGIRRAFAAVDEVASAGERVFFSTDSAELQEFVSRHLADRLVQTPGVPTYSGIGDAQHHNFGDQEGAGAEAAAVKSATDFLMFLDARQVIQLSFSSFSGMAEYTMATSPHPPGGVHRAVTECGLLPGDRSRLGNMQDKESGCRPGCDVRCEPARHCASRALASFVARLRLPAQLSGACLR